MTAAAPAPSTAAVSDDVFGSLLAAAMARLPEQARTRLREALVRLTYQVQAARADKPTDLEALPVSARHAIDTLTLGLAAASEGDLDYAALDGVNEGGLAMQAYAEAIRPETPPARKAQLEKELLASYAKVVAAVKKKDAKAVMAQMTFQSDLACMAQRASYLRALSANLKKLDPAIDAEQFAQRTISCSKTDLRAQLSHVTKLSKRIDNSVFELHADSVASCRSHAELSDATEWAWSEDCKRKRP